MDPCPTLPLGLGYPHTPITPTFLSSEAMTDGLASPPFVGSVSSSYSAAPCECVDKQLFYMNRLNHLLAESLPLRFDYSLQSIRATFYACQTFLQCSKCAKDSANLLLLISVLNLTLQLFEYWISRQTSQAPRAEYGIEIRYGYYEICHEENQQIRSFLLRRLLLQCREVLTMLTTAVDTVCSESPRLVDGECSTESNMAIEEPGNRPWISSERLMASLQDPDAAVTSAAPRSSCFLPIIVGYEATVEAFLQSISSNDCICGSNCVVRAHSL